MQFRVGEAPFCDPKTTPRRHPRRPQIDPSGFQEASQEAPRRPKTSPKRPQNRPQEAPKVLPGGPRETYQETPKGSAVRRKPKIHVRTAAKRLGSPTGRVCDARAQPRYVKEGQLQNIASLYIAKQPPLIPPQGRRRLADPFRVKCGNLPKPVENRFVGPLGPPRNPQGRQDGSRWL